MKLMTMSYMKLCLKSAVAVALFAASAPFAMAKEDSNLIVNPNFETNGEKIPGWVKMMGSLETDKDSNGEACGKVNITASVDIGEKSFLKGSIIQTIKEIIPGNYMLSFSMSGESLSAVYVVLRFQELPGIGSAPVLGSFKKYIGAQELPPVGGWKRYIFPVNVPANSKIGYFTIESLAAPDQSAAYSLINNVKLVKQED